jgi:hypothetical protein
MSQVSRQLWWTGELQLDQGVGCPVGALTYTPTATSGVMKAGVTYHSVEYFADLGVTDMTLPHQLPGMDGSNPAYTPFGGANHSDYVWLGQQYHDRALNYTGTPINLHLLVNLHGYVAPGTGTGHPAPFAGAAPQKNWLDDDDFWNNTVLVGITTLAHQCADLGYKGLAFDEELSSSNDGWSYAGFKLNFPTSTLTQAQAEAKAYQRGQTWGQAIVAGQQMVPGSQPLEYTTYESSMWPRGWDNFVHTHTSNNPTFPIYTPTLQHYFYKGVLESAHNLSHVWFINASFYFPAYFPAAFTYPWTYNGRQYDRWEWSTVDFDRHEVNLFWDSFLTPGTDRSKIDIVPFFSIPAYPGEATTSVDTVAGQWAPSIRQDVAPNPTNTPPFVGASGKPVPFFGVFCYSTSSQSFDWSPYRDGLRSAVQISTGSGTTTTPVVLTATVTDSGGNSTTQTLTISKG